MWRLLSIVVLISTAHAAPSREQLTKDEVKAASDAAVAALPKVDPAASRACQAQHGPILASADPTPDELAAAATCHRAAGSLGLAIQLWRMLIQRHPRSTAAAPAALALGPAYEAAGRFADAAESNATYAKKYLRAPAAPDRMTRAICTWRQLGQADQADRGFRYLRATWRAQAKADATTLCAAVRPIVVPPKP